MAILKKIFEGRDLKGVSRKEDGPASYKLPGFQNSRIYRNSRFHVMQELDHVMIIKGDTVDDAEDGDWRNFERSN